MRMSSDPEELDLGCPDYPGEPEQPSHHKAFDRLVESGLEFLSRAVEEVEHHRSIL
jgi:hypothetical protein